MGSVYDELLSENPFFSLLKNKYNSLYQHIITKDWVLCIPRVGSLSEQVFTIEDFCAHILVPSEELPETHYATLTEKKVTVQNQVITVEIYDSFHLQSHILFEETFYTEDFIKFKVWCVETPLEPASIKRGQTLICLEQIESVHNCIELLWTQSAGRHVLEQIELCVKVFLKKHAIMPTSLNLLRDIVGQLYTQCSQIALQNKRLRDKSKYCKQTMDCIKLAVESYVQDMIFKQIFDPICTCAAYDDSRLNKIIRNLADIQLRDLDISNKFYDAIPKAKQILSKLSSYTTTLEKVLCLKNALNSITNTDTEGKTFLLTADDLLPILVFLIIKTGLPNWYSQLVYMREFRFSGRASGMADESAFLITTLEAVIEHILSGELTGSPYPESYYYDTDVRNDTGSNKRRNSTTESMSTETCVDVTLDYLFDLIKMSQYDQVREILVKNQKVMDKVIDDFDQLDLKEQLEEIFKDEDDDITVPQLCHPLCTCKKCCRSITKKLLHTSPTVSSRDSHGLTPLHIASIHGQCDIVELLLTLHAEIDATDLNESTALHYAAAKGHQSSLLLLIHSGSDINKINIDRNTPLHLAANNGHLNCVKALIYFAENCRHILHINCVNENGDTPIHLASKWGYEDIAKILVDSGAEPSLQNNKNKSAFEYAHNLKILNILQSCSPNLYDFVHVSSPKLAYKDHKDAVARQEPPQTSENRDAKNSFENMKRIERIVRAISYGDVKLACFFMNIKYPHIKLAGEARHQYLCHPLCKCESCLKITSVAEISDFDINFTDANGNTALHFASRYGLNDLCQILIHHNADVNYSNKNRQTPLHFASINNKANTIKVLLDNGADIDVTNIAGDTALHEATDAGNIGSVKMLLKYKPNLTIKNGQGKSALDIAKDKIYLTIIDLLNKYIEYT